MHAAAGNDIAALSPPTPGSLPVVQVRLACTGGTSARLLHDHASEPKTGLPKNWPARKRCRRDLLVPHTHALVREVLDVLVRRAQDIDLPSGASWETCPLRGLVTGHGLHGYACPCKALHQACGCCSDADPYLGTSRGPSRIFHPGICGRTSSLLLL